jgi:hypothetical protein
MNLQELTTWNRLLALDLDAADATLPFSARLARDNGWPRTFAARAIEEYRKFCFLAVHAAHPVTPSDEVDQVWHLHLLYSQHYWEALCRDTLDQPLHHGPTKGGVADDHKFNDWYEATRVAYRRYFGDPPHDLWPAAHERFHARNDFVRINRRHVVTIDRAHLARGALATLAGGSVLAVARAFAQSEGPSPRAGFGVFVVLAAFVIAIVIAVVSAVRRRQQARRSRARTRAAGDGAAVAGGGAAGSNCGPDGAGGANCDGGAAATDGGGGGAGCGGGGGGG